MATPQARRAVGLRAWASRDPRSLLYALADAQLLHLRPCSHPAEGYSACSAPSYLAQSAHSSQCPVHVKSSTEAPRGTQGSTLGVPCSRFPKLVPPAPRVEEHESPFGSAPEGAQLRRQQQLQAWDKWRDLQPLVSRGLRWLPQGCLLSPGPHGGWSTCRPLSAAAAATAPPPDALPSREDPLQQMQAGGSSSVLLQEGPGGHEPEAQGQRQRQSHGQRVRGPPCPAPEVKPLEAQLSREEEESGAVLDALAEDREALHKEAHREQDAAQTYLPMEERRDLRQRQRLRMQRARLGQRADAHGIAPPPLENAGSWGSDALSYRQGLVGATSHEHKEAQRYPVGSKDSPWLLDSVGISSGPRAGSDPAESQSSAPLPGGWWAEPHASWLLPEPMGATAELPPPEDQRFLRVAVVGAPNAGKSSLVNCLVNARISAVSRKTNTTTKEVLGISTQGDVQLVFHDTPGLLQEVSGRPLSQQARASAKAAVSVMERCHVLAMVVDAERQIRRPDRRVQRWAYRLGGAPTLSPEGAPDRTGASHDTNSSQAEQPRVEGDPAGPCPGPQTRILVLNKVDAIKDKKLLLPLAAHYGHLPGFQRTFMVSARKGKGVDDLKAFLEDMAIAGPWEEDPGRRTDQAVEELAMQMVRQALLNRLHQELPYRVQQEHVGSATLRDGSVRLEQRLLVASLNQRGILLGNQGHNIREIGTVARKQVEEVLGRRVHLILDVKVARK